IWKPGFVSRFPFVGFGALTLSVCCTAAAIAVVLLSDGKPTSEWSGNRQPGVLLAYTSTLGNALLSIAFAEGVIVSFWAQALEGVRVSNLHYNWAGGNGVIGALTALRHGRGVFTGVVCLLVGATTLLRGPLMQRASFVETDTTFLPGLVDLQITDNVNNSWAGISQSRDASDVVFTPSFAKVARDFQAQNPIRIAGASCDNCSMTVPAFGFDINCTTSQQHYSLDTGGAAFFQATVFQSSITVRADGRGWFLNVTVLRKPTVACEGDLEVQTCILAPASVNYNLLLSGANITFRSGSWRDDTVIKPLNFPTGLPSSPTLSAIQRFTTSLYASTSTMTFQNSRAWFINNTGLLSNTYLTNPVSGTAACAFAAFGDPMDDVLNNFREIGLRMGVAAASDGPPYSQSVAYTSELARVIYVAHRANLAVAVVISLMGPVATLVLFWGWWKLGRSFSLSPLEIANAFYSRERLAATTALLAGTGSNASGNQVVKHVRSGGDPVVRYGVDEAEKRLVMAIAEAGTVRAPRSGEML
ncbi:hypothetical protein QBC44DRAFT_405849, partial [Cladorrhinum sp. PSN332]